MNIRVIMTALACFACVFMGRARNIEAVESVEVSRVLTDATDLHINSCVAPIAEGAVVDIVSEDAGLFFDNVSPQDVIDKYSSAVTVKGAAMVPDENCRISIYKQGTLVMAHPVGYMPLEAFEEADFTGKTSKYETGFFYTNAPANEVSADLCRGLEQDNDIRSFKLKRGYMATFATEPDGLGYSRVFIANEGDLETALPKELAGKVSFIRVFKWQEPSKKGWVGGNNQTNPPEGYLEEQCDATRSTWVYSWSDNPDYGRSPEVQGEPWRNQEFVQEKWGHGGNWDLLFNETESSHLLSYNEPDHTEQSNVTVAKAIEEWPKHLQTGKRLGSPATTDFSWLYNFMSECRKRNYRVDYVAIHAYWGGRGSSVVCSTVDDWYKKLKEIHEKTGCPIWITEWNNGANWTHEGWPDTKPEQQEKQRKFIEEVLAMMDTCSFIERYSIYNWVEEKRAMFWNNLNLTPAGKVYANFNAAQAFCRSEEVIPSWSIREEPDLSYVFNESDNAFELSWSDVNCEQVDEYIIEKSVGKNDFEEMAHVKFPQMTYSEPVDLDLSDRDVVAYRVKAVVGGKVVATSNEVQYGAIATDADTPVIGKIVTPENIRLYAYTNQYEEVPVTILGTQTYRMKTPMLPKIQSSSKSTCEIGVSMWNYNAGQSFVSQDTLSYMIFPRIGDYDFGGLKVKVGRIVNVGGDKVHVAFDGAFEGIPVVVASVQNGVNEYPIVARVLNVTENGFDIMLQREELATGGILPETVNYVALTQGTGKYGRLNLKVGVTDDGAVNINSLRPYSIEYGAYFENAAFFAATQTMNDNVTATLRANFISGDHAEVFKDREKSGNSGRSQGDAVGWCVVGSSSGSVNAQMICAGKPSLVYDSGTCELRMSDGSEMESARVFSVNGQCLLYALSATSMSLASLSPGIYLAMSGEKCIKIIKN